MTGQVCGNYMEEKNKSRVNKGFVKERGEILWRYVRQGGSSLGAEHQVYLEVCLKPTRRFQILRHFSISRLGACTLLSCFSVSLAKTPLLANDIKGLLTMFSVQEG